MIGLRHSFSAPTWAEWALRERFGIVQGPAARSTGGGNLPKAATHEPSRHIVYLVTDRTITAACPGRTEPAGLRMLAQ
jgi:hypothetical protein